MKGFTNAERKHAGEYARFLRASAQAAREQRPGTVRLSFGGPDLDWRALQLANWRALDRRINARAGGEPLNSERVALRRLSARGSRYVGGWNRNDIESERAWRKLSADWFWSAWRDSRAIQDFRNLRRVRIGSGLETIEARKRAPDVHARFTDRRDY